MENFFEDRALLDSRYYNGSLKSVIAHYIPIEISNTIENNEHDDDDADGEAAASSANSRTMGSGRSRRSRRITESCLIDDDCYDASSERNFDSSYKRVTDDEMRLMFYAPCGFERVELLTCRPFNCHADTDARAQVSLALLNPNARYLVDYANKLPIMSINVRRFKYTVKALQYAEKHIDLRHLFKKYDDTTSENDLITLGLNLIVDTEVQSLNLRDRPNQRFSTFLHRLKRTGSLEYTFYLAKILKFNVDLVYINTRATKRKCETVYRYKLSSALRPTAIGTLTVVYVRRHDAESEWFVYVHPKPLLNVN